MIVETLQEFCKILQQGKKIISIDYGKKKIGIAISELNYSIAMPLKLIVSSQEKKQLNEIINIVNQNNICGIVMGLPVNMDGTNSDQTNITKKFAEKLSSRVNLPIIMEDERLTSKEANNILTYSGLKRKERNKIDDIIAANLILENVLSYYNKHR